MSSTMKQTPAIEVDANDYAKFRSLHPGHGSWAWFVRSALRKYLQIHTVDTDELVELAVRDIRTNEIDIK